MRVSLWPKFFATTKSGVPFMTASDAQVCRKPWNEMRGLIFARSHAEPGDVMLASDLCPT